ncbi:strawberry notch family protein [Brucella sp. HL-2]|nr:strawberry notch family protein [Brucella sp. HL-2]MCV9909563.1 strawberry notch family protein [Brucella sp. HL-2]
MSASSSKILTPAPNILDDRMAGVILPDSVTGQPQQIIMVHSGQRRASFMLAARKFKLLDKATPLDVGDPQIEAFLLPARKLAPREFWKDAGLPDHRMNDLALYVNVYDPVAVARKLKSFFIHYPDAEKSLRTSALIVNRFGEAVIDTPSGRAVRTRDNQILLASDHADELGRFFLIDDQVSLRECAAHVAAAILRGQSFTATELNTLLESSAANETVEIDTILKALFREYLEAQIASRLAMPKAQAALIATSMRAEENLPRIEGVRTAERMMFQQYSTPFPVAAALQTALHLTENDRVLEPCYGNGTLASYAVGSGASVTGVELQNGRFRRGKNAHPNTTMHEGNFLDVVSTLDSDFSCVIANPPFDKLEKPVDIPIGAGLKFNTTRLECEIAVRALEKIEAGPDGRAFIILPANLMQPNELTASNDRFDTYVRMAFEKVSAVNLDGDLYKKMGTTYPVLLYALEGKREGSDYLSLAEAFEGKPASIPTIKTWDQLFSWSNEFGADRALNARAASKAAAPSAPAPTRAKTPTPAPQGPSGIAPDRDATRPAPEQARPRPMPPEDQSIIPEAPTTIDQESEPTSPENNNGFELPEVELFNDLEDDGFTMRYVAGSQTGEATTVVQKSLQGLIAQSLRQIEMTNDQSIDEFVMERFGFASPDELASRFSPEQIDALAMYLEQKKNNGGFLNGDLMGVGKGRFIAGCAYEAQNNNEAFIFMTEKPALFQDFFARDLAHVMGEPIEKLLEDRLKLAVFNKDKAAIKNANDEIVHATRDTELNSWRDIGLPSDLNAVALSYSQFQTSSGGWKLEVLKDFVADNHARGRKVTLILDESHKAAGEESTTGLRTTALVDAVDAADGTVVYSSATPLKSGKNIRLYKKVLPETGLSTDQLMAIIETNPLALQEILSMEIAREGRMISREIDSTNAIREFLPLSDVDIERMASIRDNVDRAAEHLSKLVELAETIHSFASQKATRMYAGNISSDEKIRVETISPISQFHHYSQYLMLAVKGAFLKDMTAHSLLAGGKVVIALENTGDALLESVITEQIEHGQTVNGSVILDELPTMGTVLKRMADSLTKAKIVDGLGQKQEMDLPEVAELISDFKRAVDATDFGHLCVTPVDRLRTELEAVGIPTDEISGRKRRFEITDDGKWKIVPWSQKDRNNAVHGFNNGRTDVMFLNGSGATGISMHPAPANGRDLRPRTMIKAQLQREVTAERQIEGRISRYGQVHVPRYLIPMSGFAADDRLCQLFNRNNRNLTATSTASRENKSNISESLDLLNPVGEIVVAKYLMENMRVASFLGLDPTSTDGTLARKLMGRLVCLPIDTQEQVMSALDSGFQMEIDALSARGINPLKLSSYDWRAIIDAKATLTAGDDNSSRMGDQPIKLVTLRFKERVLPRSFDETQGLVDQGRTRWFDETVGRIFGPDEHVAADDWLAPENSNLLLDLDHPIFDQKLGRSTYDLLTGGKIESTDALEILNKIASDNGLINGLYVDHKPTRYEDYPVRAARNEALIALSKVAIKDSGMTPNEIQVLRTARQSLFLAECVEHFKIGGVVALPQEICGSLSSTAIGRASAMQKHDIDLLTLGVPAIVTGISGPSNGDGRDMLNLGEWHMHMSVPGEESTISVSFASLYGGYINYLENAAAEPDKYRALSFDTIVTVLADQWTGETPFAGYLDMPQILSDGWADRVLSHPVTHEERFKLLFDQAPAGEVNRERSAIMGNLFLGIKVAGKAFAEKIVFTNELGESQHAILLKGNQRELLTGLKLQAGALPRPLTGVDQAGRAVALMQTYAALHNTSSLTEVYNRHGLNSERINIVIHNLCQSLREDYSPEFRAKVSERLPTILERLAKSIVSTAPSFILGGSEPLGLDSIAIERGNVTNAECWFDLSRDENRETEGLVKLAAGLGDKSFMLTPCATNKHNDPILVFGRRNKLIKDNFERIVEKSSNMLAITTNGRRGYKMRGALATAPTLTDHYPDLIHQAVQEHINKHEYSLVAYGGIRDLDIACSALAYEITQEVLKEKNISRSAERENETTENTQDIEFTG